MSAKILGTLNRTPSSVVAHGVFFMKKRNWTQREPTEYVTLKSNFHTRLVIPVERTPSGARYEFEPGEVNDTVLLKDRDYLLSLVYQQSSCCGGQSPQSIKYFTEVL